MQDDINPPISSPCECNVSPTVSHHCVLSYMCLINVIPDAAEFFFFHCVLYFFIMLISNIAFSIFYLDGTIFIFFPYSIHCFELESILQLLKICYSYLCHLSEYMLYVCIHINLFVQRIVKHKCKTNTCYRQTITSYLFTPLLLKYRKKCERKI